MKEAKISDIFVSFQGEGPQVGQRQLFVRFYGCSLDCAYCDTKPSSYKTFTEYALLSKVLEFTEPYQSISITGGEPLEQIAFLKEFLPILKKNLNKEIYLETNGVLYENLKQIVDYVDIIAMDIKLPSSTNKQKFWKEHEEFLRIAKAKKVFVKIIITEKTLADELMTAKEIVQRIDTEIPLILQPVDPVRDIKEPPVEKLFDFKKRLSKELVNTSIMPQQHKEWEVK